MRCNLICIEDGKIKNHSAGHIDSEESHQLIDALNKELKVVYPDMAQEMEDIVESITTHEIKQKRKKKYKPCKNNLIHI